MSSHLRHDKTCENCGYAVDVAYCSNCGQKNTETRQGFHHLAGHVVEDITHYDSGFWRTIKFLLFKPARLTQQYLSGKRQSFVPPVKLYIFISFITFFLLSIIPNTESEKALLVKHRAGDNVITVNDTVRQKPVTIGTGRTVSSIEELETIQNGPKDKRVNKAWYYTAKTVLILSQKDISGEELTENFVHTLPKVLFIYMPIFAFWLWVIHLEKRWYFFDHSIFTLHYFSFLLLLITLATLSDLILEFLLPASISENLSLIIRIFVVLFSIFYFFRAHSRMYGERKLISRLKSAGLFFINMICIILLGLVMFVYVILHSYHP